MDCLRRGGARVLAPLLIAYGHDILHFDSGERELFVMAYFCGLLTCGLLLPLLADRYGFRLLAIISTVLLAGAFAAPIAFGRSHVALYAGCFLIQPAILANLGYELVPDVRSAPIVAAGSVMTLPVSVTMGPLGGRLADVFGEAGYLAVFAVGATLSIVALFGFLLLVREPRSGQEIYVRLRKI